MRACQSGTATPPFRQSPPQQRGVQQKRGSSRRPFNDMRKRHSLQREQARQADETWRSPASRGAVAMDMPWSLLDGAQCMLEACCWYRNQQSVRECSSKYPPTVFRFSSATYSVAMKAALLRIGACSTPLSCRTSQSRRRRLGEERGSRSMRFWYVRRLAQHCMSARSHIPSTDAFAARHVWAKMHRCPQTGYSFLYLQRHARMQEQTSHRHRATIRGEGEKRVKQKELRTVRKPPLVHTEIERDALSEPLRVELVSKNKRKDRERWFAQINYLANHMSVTNK